MAESWGDERPDWGDEYKIKYCVTGACRVVSFSTIFHTLHFKESSHAQEFINEVGADDIRKILSL